MLLLFILFNFSMGGGTFPCCTVSWLVASVSVSVSTTIAQVHSFCNRIACVWCLGVVCACVSVHLYIDVPLCMCVSTDVHVQMCDSTQIFVCVLASGSSARNRFFCCFFFPFFI